MTFKLAVETVNDKPSVINGTRIQNRQNAIWFFDRIRQAERTRNSMGQSLYTNISLLTDDPAEARQEWLSADPDFPWIVDGESFDPFEDPDEL